MSASTIKPVPTLKGMFSEPKMNHRRNFLKENKLNLREKPSTGGKDEKDHKTQRTSNEHKRSTSRNRNDSEPSRNGLCKQASSSSLRGAGGGQQSQRSNCSCDCGSNKLASKPSAHKGIQTDDIHDEKYLYAALKKCTSYETKTLMSNRGNFAHNNYSEQNLALTPRSECGGQQQQMQDYYLDEQQAADGGQSGGGDADALSLSKQSMNSGITNHHYAQHGSIGTYHSQINTGMQQMALNDAYGAEPPVSGRSNKSNGSRHQLGSRDNLRLPNYLENEKRERAAERQRQNDIDPECPPGHFLLNENERQAALKDTQAKFDTLINEINRMPVTSTTMRVRNRRNEIEKELLVLESDLRALGKNKVYIKNDEPQQHDYNQ